MFAEDLIIRPLLTEKTYADIQNKRYTFIVRKDANKSQIKFAIEKLFDVKVEKVNTANYDGKLKTQGKSQGYTASYKKALVTLKEGDTIDFFSNI